MYNVAELTVTHALKFWAPAFLLLSYCSVAGNRPSATNNKSVGRKGWQKIRAGQVKKGRKMKQN